MNHAPLKAVISSLLSPGQEVFAYHLPEDFESLWSMAPCFGHVVIVWSDTPPDPEITPIRCEQVLTPLDWAVAYVALHQKWPNVLILDLQPDCNQSAPLYRRFREMRPDLFPWLHIHAAPQISFEGILDFLKPDALKESGLKIEPSHRDAHASLLREARMTLTEGGPAAEADRHAIANIIGPMVVRGGKTTESLHPLALRSLLRATGIIAPPPPSSSAAQEDGIAEPSTIIPQSENPPGEDGKGLHIVLVDDQAKHGWEGWVNDCLPAASFSVVTNQPPAVVAESGSLSAAPVSVVTDLVTLVKQVEKQLDEAKTKDLRFRLKLPGADDSKQPVLLLDLRLFSGKPDAEVAFYKDTLLPLMRRFTDRADLAWPAFSTQDQKLNDAIKAVSEKTLKQESPQHHEALTWLPRIIALADMSLPIILFSSTGRRSIERSFANYQNIILGFEKPRFFATLSGSDVEAASNSTRAGLYRSLENAADLLKGRTRARHSLQCRPQLVADQVKDRYSHFELFIDESRPGADLVVGGLVACFSSLKDSQDFDDRLVQNGVRYFPTLVGPAPAGNPLSKHQSCQNQFGAVVTEWRREKRPLHLAMITLDGIEPFTTALRFLDMDFMDNRWRLAVEAIVELFLSEIVAPLHSTTTAGEPASISIYGPTRVSLAASESDARLNYARFGTPVQQLDQLNGPPRWGNNAVAESNLLHLACNILRNHSMNVALEKVRFVRLRYDPYCCREWEVPGGNIACVVKGDNRREDEAQLGTLQPDLQIWRAGLRALHYVCDQVLFDMVCRSRPWPQFSVAIPTIHETYNKYLRGNLAASRFLDTRRPVEAMAAWQPNLHQQPRWRKGIRKASEAIGARLAVALDEILGTAFVEGSKRLSRTMRAPAGVSVPNTSKTPAFSSKDAAVSTSDSIKVGSHAGATRYFVLVENLPAEVTAPGLLEAASFGAHHPVLCEIADDSEEGRQIAAIYFEQDSAPYQVAQSLRRRGWQAKAFVAARKQVANPTPSKEDEKSLQASDKPSSPESEEPRTVGHRLRVGPVPEGLSPEKVISRLRETYPSVGSFEKSWPDRNSTKYLLECLWPKGVPVPEAPDDLLCGHERLPLEFVAVDEDEQ